MTGDAVTLHGLIDEAARDDPDRVAVIDGERGWTYGHLHERAGDLARTLAALGVRAGDRVGLATPKSAEALAGIYGILATPAAYVPLDLGAPDDRLARVLADCGPRAVVCTPEQRDRFAALARGADIGHLVLVSGDDEPAVVPLGGHREPPSGPEDLAYLLYTSGSTGSPKGVMLTHGNGLEFVRWAVRSLGIGPEDRLASHAPFHFDLSVLDLFGAALARAAVVLVPRQLTLFPAELTPWVDRQQLTVWYSVPSALSLIVEHGGLAPGAWSTLRLVLFAGEVFPARRLAQLMALVPRATYWNLYGPTETNVCTAHCVESPVTPDGPPMPIGHPIDGVRTLVVDDRGAPVASGQEGELLVSGPTVALGYWADPLRTAERFIDVAGERHYRTGDLAVELPAGGYLLRGRRDHQVKTRGHRVELGDVEAALLSADEVEDCAVVAVADELLTNRLVAHVVLGPGADRADVLSHSRRRLPRYMVPDRVVTWDQLPRLSTGKVDRQRLSRQEPTPS